MEPRPEVDQDMGRLRITSLARRLSMSGVERPRRRVRRACSSCRLHHPNQPGGRCGTWGISGLSACITRPSKGDESANSSDGRHRPERLGEDLGGPVGCHQSDLSRERSSFSSGRPCSGTSTVQSAEARRPRIRLGHGPAMCCRCSGQVHRSQDIADLWGLRRQSRC